MITDTNKINEQKTELEIIRKALKESEEKINTHKIRTEFFANLSHEFKTPLNLIMGSIQLIELYAVNGTIQDPEGKLEKYMATMKQNAYRLLKLINNIIDLSKIDSHYYDFDLHNYDIATIVNDIVESVQGYASIKKVKLSLLKSFNHLFIACDAGKIERILLNLLSNALKFTEENGNIMVKLYSDADFVYISVKDDGIGMHKDKLPLLFQKFRQIDRSFTRNKEGSGIGLSIVKALVEMHKGKIFVESEYGFGTKFTIKLPNTILDQESTVDNSNQYSMTTIEERLKIELSDL